MPILSLGISFRSGPIELLERLAFSDDDLTKAYARVPDLPGVDGAIVISTCNRMEVVGEVESYHAGFLGLKRLIAESREVAPETFAEALYSHWELDAAEHLFAVAAGLDSLVMGETQIQAQVRAGLRRAGREGASTRALDRLFHAAARAGKRVRRETAVGAAPEAFVRTAADLAAEELDGVQGRNVLIVGAGAMAGLAVRHLRRRGVGTVTIVNRTPEHARALAERTSSGTADLGSLRELLADADLVVSATGAAGSVVTEADVRTATAGRAGRLPLVLVDLAIPRDVEPSVAGVDGVRLIDIFALRDRVAARGGPAEHELGRAREIVAEEVRRWVVRRRGDELAPLIRALRARGDEVVRRELERRGSRLADLTPEQRAEVEAVARAVAAKLLHDPIVALKERSEPGTGKAHARVLAELLQLEPGPTDA